MQEKENPPIKIETGTDLVEISRIGKVYGRWGKRFLERVYTEKEREYFAQTENENLIISEMAARFAAKEAVSKLLGTGLKLLGSRTGQGVGWKEIEVLNEPTGKPFVKLYGRAEEVASRNGICDLDISLTHTGELAMAVAVALKQV